MPRLWYPTTYLNPQGRLEHIPYIQKVLAKSVKTPQQKSKTDPSLFNTN